MAKTGCDKNCSTCDIGNRAYCAVQLGLKNQELLLSFQETLTSLITVLAPLLPAQGAAPIPPIPDGENIEKAPEQKPKQKIE